MINSAEGDGARGATRIVLEARLSDRLGVQISIQDDGPGLPAELRARLGKRGFSTKPRASGLGLWLAHAALSSVGGSLHIFSETDGGARVVMTLRAAFELTETATERMPG